MKKNDLEPEEKPSAKIAWSKVAIWGIAVPVALLATYGMWAAGDIANGKPFERAGYSFEKSQSLTCWSDGIEENYQFQNVTNFVFHQGETISVRAVFEYGVNEEFFTSGLDACIFQIFQTPNDLDELMGTLPLNVQVDLQNGSEETWQFSNYKANVDIGGALRTNVKLPNTWRHPFGVTIAKIGAIGLRYTVQSVTP